MIDQLAFIGILIGGPYLTWKVLIKPALINKENEESKVSNWANGNSAFYILLNFLCIKRH